MPHHKVNVRMDNTTFTMNRLTQAISAVFGVTVYRHVHGLPIIYIQQRVLPVSMAPVRKR